MSGEPNDLWPEKFEPATMTSPEEVLAEQAQLLESKTDGILRADVVDASDYSDTDEFARKFMLVAPKLRGYRYTLFTVTFPVTLYPVTFHNSPLGSGGALPAGSEGQFREQLRRVLGCPETKRIIASLMTQSAARDRLERF